MFVSRTCHQCGKDIESDENFARLKNPALGEIGYIYFHQRESGDCYWQYLRDFVIKSQNLVQTKSYQVT